MKRYLGNYLLIYCFRKMPILCNSKHWWRRQVQFRSIFDERHELGQEICTNARNTAGLYGLSLSCCFDLIVFITKISKHWEFAPIAWLCPWRSYIILSEFVVFVENGTKLNLTMPSMSLYMHSICIEKKIHCFNSAFIMMLIIEHDHWIDPFEEVLNRKIDLVND